MKLKVLVMLIGFALLATLTVCVTVHAYNAWASGSRNANAGTITMSGGANGNGLISGKTRATVKVDGEVHRDEKEIAPGKKDSVSKSEQGRDNRSGSGSGYVSGKDVHGCLIRELMTCGTVRLVRPLPKRPRIQSLHLHRARIRNHVF